MRHQLHKRDELLTGLLVAGLLVLWTGEAHAQALVPNAEQQFFDSDGSPLAGGRVYFYLPGTQSLKTTYSDPASTMPNSDPVLLDSAGRAVIWGSGAYREVVLDTAGNLIWDRVTSVGGNAGVQQALSQSGPVGLCSGIIPIQNTTGAPITLLMPPAPTGGTTCEFVDVGNNAASWPIQFSFGALPLTNGQNFWTMNTSGQAITFTFLGSPAQWVAH